MIRLVTVASAMALFFVPALTAAIPAVLLGGTIGLCLAAFGIITLWRWPLTAAACVFLVDYAAALWVADPAVSIVGAAGVGLALLALVHSAELARGARHATVDARVFRSQIVGWAGVVAATLGTAVGLVALARVVAGAVPLAGAPLLVAAGALGVVLALAAALVTPARRPRAHEGV